MNFRTTKTRLLAGAAAAAIVLGGIALAQPGSDRARTTTVDHVHVDSAVDIRDDRRVVGIAHSVFFGQVTRKLGQTLELAVPETQYEVKVLDSIKGTLSGVVTVNQFGGETEGRPVLLEGEQLLEEGKTYLLVTRTRDNGWHTVVSGAGAVEVKGAEHRRQLHERFSRARNNQIPPESQGR